MIVEENIAKRGKLQNSDSLILANLANPAGRGGT